MIIPGTPQAFIFKMIISTVLPFLIGGSVLFVAAIVGACFIFSGWPLFFAIVGIIIASILLTVGFVYYKIQQMRKKVSEGMSNLQNAFGGMMSGGGVNLNKARSLGVIDEKLYATIGATVGAGATLIANSSTKAVDATEAKAVNDTSVQIPENASAKAEGDESGQNLMEVSDEFLIAAMKEEFSAEEFAQFESLGEDEKKKIIQAYREVQMMDDSDDLMSMFGSENGSINPFAAFGNMSEEDLKAAQEMNPFEMMQNMSEEEKQQAQQMMQQMMAMFGGAGIDMSKMEEQMANMTGKDKNPLLDVQDVPIKSENPK